MKTNIPAPEAPMPSYEYQKPEYGSGATMAQTDAPAPEADIVARLDEIAATRPPRDLPGHTEATAKEAAAEIRALRAERVPNRCAFDTPALHAAREILALTREGQFDDVLKAKIQCAIIDAMEQHFTGQSSIAQPALRARPPVEEVGEIVESLREPLPLTDGEGRGDLSAYDVALMADEERKQAADTLERLSRRVAELEERYVMLDTEYGTLEEEKHQLEDDVQAATAELERLRAARQAAEAQRDAALEVLGRIELGKGHCSYCLKEAEGPGGGAVSCDDGRCNLVPHDPAKLARDFLRSAKETE